MSSAAERKASQRARMRAAGLRKYELWLLPSQWPAVRALVEKLKHKPNKANRGPA